MTVSGAPGSPVNCASDIYLTGRYPNLQTAQRRERHHKYIHAAKRNLMSVTSCTVVATRLGKSVQQTLTRSHC